MTEAKRLPMHDQDNIVLRILTTLGNDVLINSHRGEYCWLANQVELEEVHQVKEQIP